MSLCTAADVLDGPLRPIDLAVVGDRATQEAWMTSLLPAIDEMVSNTTNRDFQLHTGDVVYLDGNGANQLAVWKDDQTLCAPILALTEVRVYDTVLNVTDVLFDASKGIIGTQGCVSNVNRIGRRWRRGIYDTFPRDFKNVKVTLSWGYAEIPDSVKIAAAFVAASVATAAISGGVTGGIRAKRIEDFEVQYAAAGPYAPQMTAWLTSAMAMLNNYRTGRKSS